MGGAPRWVGGPTVVVPVYQAALARLAREVTGPSIRRNARVAQAAFASVASWAYRSAARTVSAWADERSLKHLDGSLDLRLIARLTGLYACVGAVAVVLGGLVVLTGS